MARGPVAADEWQLMQTTLLLMLVVLIPVFVLAVWIPWHYRAGNTNAHYAPDWAHSHALDLVVWLVPTAIVVALGVLTWQSTHRLDPYKPVGGAARPLPVQVVALDWNWLFIYPQQHIATVNKLVIPSGRPVDFDITSATVMDSFFIPRLGSQVYAMPGMTTRLNLEASRPGRYVGRNTQYSGRGFSDQRFRVIASSAKDFSHWIRQVRDGAPAMSESKLAYLLKAHASHPVESFGRVPDGLFARLRGRFNTSSR